nr:pentatricopeptide repeat-containing protein At5g66520-like [Ipomoea batatas]
MIQKPFITATQTDSTLSLFMQKCKTLSHLKQIHAHLLKLYLPESPSSIAPLLSFAVSSKNPAFFSYARAVFQNLQFRSTFVYNTMIRGYVQSHLPVPAILCYKEMLSYKLIVNNYTFTPLIKACSMVLDDSREMGFSVHAHIFKLGFQQDRFIASALIEFYSLGLDMRKAGMLFDEIPERDVVMWTTMIDGYGKTGEVNKARALFEEMPDRNVISWSTILAAYSRVSDFKEVMVLYRQMEEVGMRPNESVLVTAVTACAHLGSLEQGLWIHSLAKRYGYDSNLILATALVDMYSKCGRMDFALSVFEGISCKDTGSWNAILSGFAMNGDAVKSLQMFDKMVSTGARPNETTFISLLSACTHAKLIDNGLLLFDKMSSVYGVKPRFEHHACVVDLLARAGNLEEAEKFIDEKMGGIEKCDPNVWGALLSACRVYGNVEIGNRLWRKLCNTRAANYGTHMLSYIMYKEAGWDAEAKSVRQLIEDAGMKKKPGCSSIELSTLLLIVAIFYCSLSMAKLLTVRAENHFCCLSQYTTHKAQIFKPISVPPIKHGFRFRVSCLKEKEKEFLLETKKTLNGIGLNGELGKKGGLIQTSGDELGAESRENEVGFYGDWPPWKNLPQRYKLIGTTALAFVICNMDKVNLSVAIIPMSHQFGWNSSVAGLVQSSFFWGYALSQLPGGWLAKIFGGRKVLEVGVLVWSLATALVPILSGFMPALIFSRILVGIGEGVSPSAATDLIARHVNTIGRAFTGSIVCFWWFEFWKRYRTSFGSSSNPKFWLGICILHVWLPWHSLVLGISDSERRPVLFLSNNYVCEELNLNLTEAAWVSVFPPLASIFVTTIASQFADNLISKGVETTVVRKICQTIAFLSPATCMILSSLDFGLPPWEVVTILTGGLALSSFALSGLYCTHQDISPEYASILLGITNTVGAVPGIVGVALTGYLLDSTHSWSISLFAPSIFFYLTGTIVWLAFASSKPQKFSKED